MVNIPMRSSIPNNKNSITNINVTTQDIKTAQSIMSINAPERNTAIGSANSNVSSRAPISSLPSTNTAQHVKSPASLPNIAIPKLANQMQKGQKVPLDPTNTVQKINVCIGWNVNNPQCDIDVSAFILGADSKVLGDDWFIFYGQEYSPDKAVHFSLSAKMDREYIAIDLSKLDPRVNKIVFVLTINDALKNNLNFSMVKDAYIRILNADNQCELVSFKLTDYYSNVISMMIGEIYLLGGNWKCNAIGNGVAKDLTGLCGLYGVQII